MNKLFAELRRRNVFRVAGVYAVVGWLLMQVVAVMTPALNMPDWVDGFFAILLIVGFPIAIILAWAFEMTPDGMKLTAAAPEGETVAPRAGKELDFVISGGLALVAVMIIADRLMPEKSVTIAEPAAQAENTDAASVTSSTSIAVLPFTDLSPNKDQEYFSDGIAEEILNVLVRVDSLKVASRTSAFGFKGQEALGIPLIAEKLNVRHILEGSVRKSGETVRITAQLIDAQTDQHLWSDTYDRTLTAENLFAIQDEIANAIAKELGLLIDTGGDTNSPAVTVTADTQNLDAYELYLRGHQLFITRNKLPEAISLLERAVVADAGFARAWTALAAAYAVAPSWQIMDRDYAALAADAAEKAIALNPDLALPYAVLGNIAGILGSKFDYNASLARFDEALQRDPKETTALLWRGIVYLNLGYFEKGEEDFLQCLHVDPAYENCRRFLALSKLYQRDVDAALALYEAGARKGFAGSIDPFIYAYAATGNLSAVLAYAISENPTARSAPLAELSYRIYTEEHFDFARERAGIEAVYAAAGRPVDWDAPYYPILAFALRDYANVSDIRAGQPFKWRPFPEQWRVSPHRKRMIIESGLPEYWREHGFPPQCKPIGKDDFECE